LLGPNRQRSVEAMGLWPLHRKGVNAGDVLQDRQIPRSPESGCILPTAPCTPRRDSHPDIALTLHNVHIVPLASSVVSVLLHLLLIVFLHFEISSQCLYDLVRQVLNYPKHPDELILIDWRMTQAATWLEEEQETRRASRKQPYSFPLIFCIVSVSYVCVYQNKWVFAI